MFFSPWNFKLICTHWDKNLFVVLLLFDAWLGHLHILRHIYRMTQEVIKSICHWNTCLFHCPKQMLKTAVLNVIYPDRYNTQDKNWATCYAWWKARVFSSLFVRFYFHSPPSELSVLTFSQLYMLRWGPNLLLRSF